MGEKFNNWTENNIYKPDLSKLSGEELILLLEKFDNYQGKIYAVGTALPVLDWQKFTYVENFLNDYLKKNVNEKEYQDYYTLFTEPPANSFAQDQEEALLNIMVKYWDYDNWRKDIETKSLDDLKELHKDFYRDLEEHTNKHAWVYYAYNGPESTEEDFLSFIRDYLIKLEHPEKLLKNLGSKRKNLEKRKQEFYKKYKPTEREKNMLNLAGKFVWGKPRRKDYQAKSYYHAKKLQSEISKRLHLSLEQVRNTPFDMIKECLVDGKEPDNKIINSIKKYHIIIPNQDKTVSILIGQEAEEFEKAIHREEEQEIKNIKELRGTTACPGKVQGTVKIINNPADMAKMEYNDILVSVSTTPNIIAAMKKASAFVTDEGGLTCHAAIVARELSTPCVVGTKFATKVFKDGDIIEVDAEKRMVRKL
ncbi:hypothetical protein KKH39_04210 [Patescibacteria group bacterium]|nr:hypothetical protein [Patescibacteria group bacterium]